MKLPVCHPLLSYRLCVWSVFLAGTSGWFITAQAAQWDIRPRLSVSETYTDNVRLGGIGGFGGVGGGGGGGDFITQINPGVSLTGDGRRFSVNANYTLNNLFFANRGRTLVRQQLNSNGTAEILRDLFFVDGRAAISQQNAFLFGSQAADNANLSGNLRDIRTWSISPYARHRFKNLASGEVRYARSGISSNARRFFNNSSDAFIASLNSGSAFRTLGWGINYTHTEISRERAGVNLGTIELERTTGTVRYVVTSQFSLIGTGGYERNSFISIRGKPSSHFWTAGFSWEPTRRTSLSASGGERFFGKTFSGAFDHRTRRTLWNASYVEDITTFGQQQSLFGGGILNAGSLGQLPGITDGTALLNQGLPLNVSDPNNFLTNRLFLLKRFQASLTLNGRKNSLVFRVFNLSRKSFSPDQEDADLIGLQNALLTRDTKQVGGNVLWNHRLGPRTNANVNFGYTRFNFNATNRSTDNIIAMLSVNKQFTENMNAGLSYRHQRRITERAISSLGNDFSANAITATLNMNF
ncbi:MAG: TIGR03016 family PEP-CTERM system-associated outer membrane protein [Nitrosomonas sp.]|nr:TIGR03016 family PEP-CTERM system-associated outer membrane protein [Nitrosomonas sp.]